MFQTSGLVRIHVCHWIVLGVCALAFAGCRVQPEDEVAACKNLRCTAGTCRLIGETATCVCTPVELVQGVECAVAPDVVVKEEPPPLPDDFGNDFASAAELPLGLGVAGRIGEATANGVDIDMFWVATSPGEAYSFVCTHCTVRPLHPDGTEATRVDSGGPEVVVRATAERLYLELTGTERAKYMISGTLKVDDAADSPAGAAEMREGSQINVLEVSDDVDVFRLVPDPQRGYLIDAHTSSGTLLDLSVMKGSGEIITSASKESVLVAFRDQSEPVFIRFAAASPTSYTWRVRQVYRDDFPDSTADVFVKQSFPLIVNGILNGPDDVDTLKFDVSHQHAVSVTCTSLHGGDCSVELLDSAGTSITSDANGTTVTLFGTTWALLRGAGEFRLRMEWTDDFPASLPIEIQIGTTVTGEIDYEGDVDAFRVSTYPDHYYRATCTSSTGSCTASTYQIKPSGEFRTNVADDTRSISVKGTLGPWSLTVEDLGWDDARNSDQNLSVPEPSPLKNSQSGQFEVGWDSDCFRFDFPSGTYTLAQASGVPAEVALDGVKSALPYTFTFTASNVLYTACFAPAPWFSANTPGATGPYSVTLTAQ